MTDKELSHIEWESNAAIDAALDVSKERTAAERLSAIRKRIKALLDSADDDSVAAAFDVIAISGGERLRLAQTAIESARRQECFSADAEKSKKEVGNLSTSVKRILYRAAQSRESTKGLVPAAEIEDPREVYLKRVLTRLLSDLAAMAPPEHKIGLANRVMRLVLGEPVEIGSEVWNRQIAALAGFDWASPNDPPEVVLPDRRVVRLEPEIGKALEIHKAPTKAERLAAENQRLRERLAHRASKDATDDGNDPPETAGALPAPDTVDTGE